jgi:TatA/E family protein of Tat protein translocase
LLTIVLLFFGAKRVPQLGRSLVKGIREFREGMAEASHHSDDDAASAAELRARNNEEEEEPSPSEADRGRPSHAQGERNARIGQKP